MSDLDPQIQEQLIKEYAEDPILCARQLFPHWFSRPMPWFHRGLIAILLRRADFLLNFTDPSTPEKWEKGDCRWTKKKLAKLVKHFTYRLRPKDPHSPSLPIFHIRYAEDRRTPVAIDMVLGTHVSEEIPRGFSKTTIINFTSCYKTVYKLTKFTVYISEAAPHARDQLATIRRELSGNERLIAVFGNLKPDRTDDETWGADSFETITGVKFVAKGRGAQIRGLNKFGDRPDTIILDDVEDKESVTTDVQREKTLSWYKGDVEQALAKEGNPCIYALGTILHPKALLPTLSKDPDYTSINFGAAIPTGEMVDRGKKDKDGNPVLEPVMEPLWDDPVVGMTLAKIEAKKQSFALVGKLYEFNLEFMSRVRDEEKLKFKSEYIRYRTYMPKDFVARSIHIDPAISGKPGADYCCIAVVGIMENGHKHVCDFWAKQGAPMSEQADRYFDMKIAWDCTHHSSESTAYQAALAQVIRQLMFIKSKTYGVKAYFEIRDVWPGGRKIERVEGILQPIMSAGYLTFQKIWPELEVMFNGWPDEKLDGPDAIAGAVANLEPYAPLSGDAEAMARNYYTDPEFEAPCPAGNGTVP